MKDDAEDPILAKISRMAEEANRENPGDRARRGIQEFLEEIRIRPAVWFGRKSLLAFEAFMQGFWVAESMYELKPEDKLCGFDWMDFEEWVDQKYNVKRLSVRSLHLAGLSAESDEDGFDRWFAMYDEYRSKQNLATELE